MIRLPVAIGRHISRGALSAAQMRYCRYDAYAVVIRRDIDMMSMFARQLRRRLLLLRLMLSLTYITLCRR